MSLCRLITTGHLIERTVLETSVIILHPLINLRTVHIAPTELSLTELDRQTKQRLLFQTRDGHGLGQSMGWVEFDWVDFFEFFVGWVVWVQEIRDGFMQCKHLTYICCISNGMRIRSKSTSILPH